MSQFDKSVYEWVTSSNIERENKQQILQKLIDTIEEYKRLETASHPPRKESNETPAATSRGSRTKRGSHQKKAPAGPVDYEFVEVVRKALAQLEQEALPPLAPPHPSEGEAAVEEEQMPLNSATRVYQGQKQEGDEEEEEDEEYDEEREGQEDEEAHEEEEEEEEEEGHNTNSEEGEEQQTGENNGENDDDNNDKKDEEVVEYNENEYQDEQKYENEDADLVELEEENDDENKNENENNNEEEGKEECEQDAEETRQRFEEFKFGGEHSTTGFPPLAEANGNLEVSDSQESSEDDVIEDNEDERRRNITMKRPSRPGVSALSIDAEEIMSTEVPPTPKSNANISFIKKVLESHFLFSFLDDAQLLRLAMVMEVKDYTQGSKLLVKGETSDTFYIILEGEATMTSDEEDVNGKNVVLQKAAVFGDLGLLYEAKNEVNVEATTPLVCATLERNTYKILVARAAEEKRMRYASFLSQVPFLQELTTQERSKLSEALKEGHFSQGEHIIKYGEKGDWLHIIVEGTADVIGRNDDGENEYVTTLHTGDCAGELEFMFHHETVADVIAASADVKTAMMSRRHFENLIGSAKELLERKVKEDESYQYYRRTMHGASPPREDLAPPFDEPPEHMAHIQVRLEL